MRLLAAGLLSLAMATSPALAAPAKQAACRTGDVESGKQLEISGSLYLETQYGPPGYGANPKTDRRDRIGIVKLDDPMDVKLPFTEYHVDQTITVKEIQVVPQKPGSVDVVALSGKHVVITGSLFEPDNSDHVRPVLIYASGGRPGGKVGCDGKEQAGH